MYFIFHTEAYSKSVFKTLVQTSVAKKLHELRGFLLIHDQFIKSSKFDIYCKGLSAYCG